LQRAAKAGDLLPSELSGWQRYLAGISKEGNYTGFDPKLFKGIEGKDIPG